MGSTVTGEDGQRIGRVEAAFVDYLLIRTGGLIPVDLYIPRPELVTDEASSGLRVSCRRREAYARWHRPLRRAPHD